jgi:hypothetical protein
MTKDEEFKLVKIQVSLSLSLSLSCGFLSES